MTATPSSARGYSVAQVDETAVARLVSEANLSSLVARILVSRGVEEPDDARVFLEPTLDAYWRDPEMLPGMTQAADAVAEAIRAEKSVCVFGDFDADGVTAAALAVRGLRGLDGRVDAVLPHRFREGYGLTRESVDRLIGLAPDMVVTVDCGVSAAEQVARLAEAGVDVVVTDHHEPGGEVPQGVPVTDPKLVEESDGVSHGLSGAGMALKLVQAVGERVGRPDAYRELTDLAALGTIGDVVPLLGENRGLVGDGLARMRAAPRAGLAALGEVAGLDMAALASERAAFGIVPRLNAAGRVSDPRVAFDLLMTDEADEAARLARELDECNRIRQQVELDLFEQAAGVAQEAVEAGSGLIVVAGEGWHEGVRGIVASRLTRLHRLPAFVFTTDGEEARGSGRSVPGLDLFAALSSVEHLFDRFGGHSAAVGATLPAERLREFELELSHVLAAARPAEPAPLVVDGAVRLDELGLELAAELALLEPFGEGNRRPRLVASDVFMNARKRVGKELNHLVFTAFDGVVSVGAVAFRCPDIEGMVDNESAVDLVFELEEDTYRGRSRARMFVRHILLHDPTEGPAAALVDELFESAPAILAGGEYQHIGEAESFHTKLAGVTFEGRQESVAELEPGAPLRLERQPENPHDTNAVAVFDPRGRQVGFFNRRLAEVLAPLLDDGLDLDVTVTDVTGGGEGESLGVNVLVTRRQSEAAVELEVAEERRKELASLSDEALTGGLATHFIGERELLEAQATSLGHLASGRSCLTVMATGRGKSLIFHLHAARLAIAEGKASVFVYPLRALVSDQAFHLTESMGALGVGCRTITGETAPGARDECFGALTSGEVDVLLTTPEFLERHAERFASAGRVGFMVVDEAHHVGLARAGRRPAYSRLGAVAETLSSPVVLAVTATAGDDVAQVVEETLGIDEVVADPSRRDNLRIHDQRTHKDKVAYVASLAARGEKAVVYVNSRSESVRIAERLRRKVSALTHGVAFYNGGVGRLARHAIEHAFREGDLRVVVATSAFGEGVNIPDIDHVVHYHLPFNDVEFNQMSGRAGRDGREAGVHLLYGPKDARINEMILTSVAPPRDDLAELYLALKRLDREDGEGFEVTNAELAEEVEQRRPKTRLGEKGVSAGLGVFRELGLVESEGAGSYRRLRLLPAPEERLDLASSTRYAEGLAEQETFEEFRRWALEAPAEELLARFDSPILPTRSARGSERQG
jgi:single-stranded-DNA-specific exonuclease